MKKRKAKIIAIIVAVIVVAIGVIAAVLLLNKDKDEGYRVIKIKSYENEVSLSRNGEDVKVFEGISLQTKDTVTTKEKSTASLLADSDKHILASENTCFDIVTSGNEKEGKIQIDISYGTVLFDIEEKLPKNSTFEVNTPNASLSVRGTTFEVSYDKETNKTSVSVIEGAVNVKTQEESHILNYGGTAVIKDESFESFDNPNEEANELFAIAGGKSEVFVSLGFVEEMPTDDGQYQLARIINQRWTLLNLEGWEVKPVETTTMTTTTTTTTTTIIDADGNVIMDEYPVLPPPQSVAKYPKTIMKDGIEITFSSFIDDNYKYAVLVEKHTVNNADGQEVTVGRKEDGTIVVFREIDVDSYGYSRPDLSDKRIFMKFEVVFTTDEAREIYSGDMDAFAELTRDMYYEIEND